MIKNLITAFIIIFLVSPVMAQESLLKGIEDSVPVREKVTSAFKSTRVINAHSVEMLAKGNLDFRILHRFGRVNDGVKQWFGLDNASMRMSFDYGLTNNLMIGIGRSTFRKEIDYFVKGRVFQQSKGPGSIPFSLIIAVGSTIWTESSDLYKTSVTDRTAHYVQIIAGRKFSENFSLQLSPVIVHRNLIEVDDNDNTIYAIGGGARYKVSKRIAFTADYHHVLNGLTSANTDPLSVGIDIETGGHVFQLHFSNVVGMNERAYITQTTDNFFNGDIRFGFNLSRIFKVGHKRK
jgi:opacity protein-like surface antigen